MRGEELPQLLGGEVGPMVAAAVDGDQHHAAVVGTSGGRGGDRPAGRDGRRLTLIDLAPERIQVRYRRGGYVGASTGRGRHRAGRDARRLTWIDLAPERIQVRYRRAVDVDEATAGPATVGNQRICR